MISVRPETSEDLSTIFGIHLAAFGGENESRLVDALRRSKEFIPELSLVAIRSGQVVGHILFSPVTIQLKEAKHPALALAPMAVLPEFQKQGVGSVLVRQGLERCRALGHRIVIVVGHPAYYPRFGFSPARAKGLEVPFPVPEEAFMVIELIPGTLQSISGMVIYPAVFNDV